MELENTYKCLEYLYFIHEGVEVLDSLLLNRFNCILLQGRSFFSEVNDTESARGDLLGKVIFVFDLALVRVFEQFLLVCVFHDCIK